MVHEDTRFSSVRGLTRSALNRRTLLRRSGTAGIGWATTSLLLTSSHAERVAAEMATQSEGAVDSGTFIGLVRNQPNTGDPHIGSDNPTGKFLVAAYEPLIRVKPGSTELEPALAEAWEISDDGLTYLFRIRPGVEFHDGSALDAEAVKLSFDRLKQIGLGNAFALNPVSQIQTPDPMTVEITLTDVYGPFLENIPLVYIASAQAIKEHSVDDDLAQGWFNDNEAGTGPYTLTEWTRNARMTLSKYESYWRGWDGNHFSELILQMVPESSTQRQLMEAGQADWADSIGVDDLLAMRENPAFRVEAEKSLSLYYIMMNTNRPPLDNPSVRSAMRYAFDYDSLATDILQGLGYVAQGYLPEQYAAHNPDIPTETYDLDQARALIEEAQLSTDLTTLELRYFEGTVWERPASELFAARLSEIGLTLELSGVPWATMLTEITDPNLRPHFAYFSSTGGTSSPDSVFSKSFYSKSNHWSAMGYANPEVDALIEQAQQTLDEEERTEIFRDIQVILQDDSPGINSVIGPTNHVFKQEVMGYTMLTFQPGLLDYFELYRSA